LNQTWECYLDDLIQSGAESGLDIYARACFVAFFNTIFLFCYFRNAKLKMMPKYVIGVFETLLLNYSMIWWRFPFELV